MDSYEKLTTDLALRTGLHSTVVKRVLFYLPDSLIQMDVGDSVRTPLGIFRMIRSKERPIILPDGKTTARVPAKIVVKLRPSNRLKFMDD